MNVMFNIKYTNHLVDVIISQTCPSIVLMRPTLTLTHLYTCITHTNIICALLI